MFINGEVAMSVASTAPPEKARKAMQLALQALQEPGKAGAVAAAMGVSDSTVSRIKTERMEEVLLLLAHLGLKVVPSDYRCVEPAAYEFLVKSHRRVMDTAPQLIWGVEE